MTREFTGPSENVESTPSVGANAIDYTKLPVQKLPKPEVAPDDGLRTPLEHAEETGNMRTVPTGPIGVKRAPTAEHRAAAGLHGWEAHSNASAEPLRFSRDDYYKALYAAHNPDAKGVYTPHHPAESPYSPLKKLTPRPQ
jgi:hypothetical protein